MEARLATYFLSQGWCYGAGFNTKHGSIRFYPSLEHRLLPASCKMCRRHYSSQNKIAESEQGGESSNSSITRMKDSADEFDTVVEAEQTEIFFDNSITNLKDSADGIDFTKEAEQANEINSLTLFSENKYPSIIADAEDQLSSVHLEDLIRMIRNAQKNIHMLNQARIRAFEDLEKIVGEKETTEGTCPMFMLVVVIC